MQTVQSKQNKSSLSTAVMKGTSWLMLFQILDNCIAFIRLIVIARLLSPNDYGLIGIALLLLQILNTFSQTGIQQYIIHKKEYKPFLNVGWTYLIFRGFVLYGLLFFTAPYISQFFNNLDAENIIKIVGISVLLDGFTNIGVVLFQKNMTFRKQFYYQFAGNFADFIVALILALLLHNVWALVWGTIANSLFRLLFSYLLSDYKPKFDFNLRLLKEMNHYGKWIFRSNVLQFLYSQGDDILVGRFLGTASLGYYQMAYRISNLPATQITHLISTVMFPAYSRLQSDIKSLANGYFKVLEVISYLSFFVGILIVIFSTHFTFIIMGEKWLPIVVSMQILTVWGVIRSIGATLGPVWQGIGQPRIITKLQTYQVIILLLLIFPLTYYYNIVGTSIAVVISALIPNLIAISMMSHTLNVSTVTFYKILIYPVILSITDSLMYFVLKNTLFIDINIINFLSLAVFVIITQLIMSIVLSKYFGYSIFTNIYMLIQPRFVHSRYEYEIEKLFRIVT